MNETDTQHGTVIAAYRHHTLVKDINNHFFKCQQRKSVGQVVCGDVVLWQQEGEKDCGVITSIEERQTILQRPDINNNLRIIASNIDKVFIVVAHKPELNEGLIDRYLVAAENSHLNPVILLNKIDLFSEQEFVDLKQRLQLYQDIGYTVIYTSAKKENGLDSLNELLKGNNNIFVSKYIQNLDDLRSVFTETYQPNIQSIRFIGNHWFHRKQINVTFYEIPFQHE